MAPHCHFFWSYFQEAKFSNSDKKMRSLFLISLSILGAQSQTNFGGSSSSSSSNRGGSSSSRRGSSSSSSSSNANNKDVNNKLFGVILPSTGNSGTDGLLNGGLLGAGLAVGAGALLGSSSNPCGRKKRQTNNKIFGFGSSTNCGNTGNFGRCDCQCSDLTFYSNGATHGNCRQADNTGRYWCYTTGYNNNCGDLQSSSRYPNNPWSYNACQRQHECNGYNNSRDCKGRPLGDEFFGCGCSRRKRQDTNTRFFDLRCAKATILGRKAVQK